MTKSHLFFRNPSEGIVPYKYRKGGFNDEDEKVVETPDYTLLANTFRDCKIHFISDLDYRHTNRNITINNHFDLIEANEAFAAQALADGQGLKWDWDKVNVNGGAIALGHPIGASGTRILTTLIYALKDRGLKTGMATLCLGGGNAVALSIEIC